jgi:hypothetical protein
VSAERSSSARSWVVPAVARSVGTFAPERRAQREVGWQRGEERADAARRRQSDLDVAADEHRVGMPVGEHQRMVTLSAACPSATDR